MNIHISLNQATITNDGKLPYHVLVIKGNDVLVDVKMVEFPAGGIIEAGKISFNHGDDFLVTAFNGDIYRIRKSIIKSITCEQLI